MLRTPTASFSRKLICGTLRGTGHQPLSQLERVILIAALAIAMSSPGSRERALRWGDCVLGLSPRDQEQ